MFHERRQLKWFERFQIEIVIHYNLFPTRYMTWKAWAFSPNFGITLPNQEITNHNKLPEYTPGRIDTLSTCIIGRKYFSSVFYIHAAIRILGLDFGFGIFYRKQQVPTPTLVTENVR